MPEPATQPQAPAQGNPPAAEPGTPAPSNQSDNILSRVDDFMKKSDPGRTQPAGDGAADFDFSELESIPDPQQKEILKKAYNSLRNGFSRKFQELADLRKQLQSQPQFPQSWTPDRIQALLNDPSFVQAANQIAGSGSQNPDDDDSYLSPKDKQMLQQTLREIENLKRNSMKTMWQQQDAMLSQKYDNYDSNAVDTITADMISGKVQATREHLWKVIDYDNLAARLQDKVKAAYEMGRNDERTGSYERADALSTPGMNVNPANEPPKPLEGENPKSFFMRLGLANLQKQKSPPARM